jgi:hypothetical protein
MTETGEPAQMPDEADSFAESLLEARTKFLQIQKLILASERGEERIRRHGRDPGGELAMSREHLEEAADRCLLIEQAAAASLVAKAKEAAWARQLTPRLARYALVAGNADEEALADFDSNPGRGTRVMAAYLIAPELTLDIINRGGQDAPGKPEAG